jgi:serine/threonine protein phosphatase PrpC
MGTYLSTPVTDKCKESDEDLDCRPSPIAWGVVDMQGWRKSMEDAHIARTNVPLQKNKDSLASGAPIAETAKVFGVFDGHGGAEVARFCQLYLVSVLTQQAAWKQAVLSMQDPASDEQFESVSPKESLMGKALVNTFHALDRMIDDPSRR